MNQEFDDFDRPHPQQPEQDPFDTFFTDETLHAIVQALPVIATDTADDRLRRNAAAMHLLRSLDAGHPVEAAIATQAGSSPTFGPSPPSIAPQLPASFPAPRPARSTPPSAVPIASASSSMNWTAGRATSRPSKHHLVNRSHETLARHLDRRPPRHCDIPAKTDGAPSGATSHPRIQSSMRETLRQSRDAAERPTIHRYTASVSPKVNAPPNFRRELAHLRSRRNPIVQGAARTRRHFMRKTLFALTATVGLLSLGSVGASAVAPGALAPAAQPATAAIQQADWYCGPRCEYWHHRRWVERHRYWRHEYYPYYGYNYGYRSYYP
jgi:hypothetical protein